ncbi:hypothetical protein [Peribacillus asahii]|uniref:hypothetical protein n=1 Tax=Peribacillus asahii TaxID=228899 RepID=UPI00207A33AE|nr:hypothetical protein [Peribacillus asahii]USK58223.1 hypothetical protein LIT37_13195 [Peribacillus asahii]
MKGKLHIKSIYLKEDNEVEEFGTLDDIYEGQPIKIRIQAGIHIEDVDKEIVL